MATIITVGGAEFHVENFAGMTKKEFFAKYKGKLKKDLSAVWSQIENKLAEVCKAAENKAAARADILERFNKRNAVSKEKAMARRSEKNEKA